MKLSYTILALGILSSPLQAITLSTTFKNLQGANNNETNVVYSDNTGAVIAQNTGYVAIGTFSISNTTIAALSTPAALDAAFSGFGTSTDFNITGGGFQAVASADPDTLFDGANTFTGRNVYIVVGNNSSIATSTEFLVWDSGLLFDNTAPNGAPDEVTLDAGSGTLVIGRDDKNTFDLSSFGGSATEVAFTTVELVPEPSSTSLLGLAGVALLLRRRK